MMKLRCFSDEKLLDLLKDACYKESNAWTEKKYFPEAASEDLVTPAERDEMMAYLLEVCERSDMSFSIETFALTVTLIDRFLASFKVKSKYLECLSVSCLYLAAKVREEDEKISITKEFLYDCNSKCSVSELLRMELMILSKFEWSIDDMTAADFLYIFHANLVNKFNALTKSHKPSMLVKNKWNVADKLSKSVITTDSAYPPSDLDFLHELEYKLKQLLCNHELATVFRSKVISFALLSIQMEKVLDQDENSMQPSTKFMMIETLRTLQEHAKIKNESLKDCMEKVKSYLETIDADKNLLDSYMDQYYSEMARNHKANSRLSVTLSTIAKHLTAIKEEDEEEEMKPEASRVLASISNQFANNHNQMDMASNFYGDDEKKPINQMSQFKSDFVDLRHVSYADMVLNRRDQKRKLSEHSITDEDYDFDSENRN